MLDKIRTRLAVAGDDVEHAGRQPCFGGGLPEHHRVESCFWRRLEDHGASRRQRGGELHCRQELRDIPRSNRGHHADRLAAHDRVPHQTRPGLFDIDGADQACVISKDGGGNESVCYP